MKLPSGNPPIKKMIAILSAAVWQIVFPGLPEAWCGGISAVPPEWGDRIVFRHSFGGEIGRPDLARAEFKIEQDGGRIVREGFLGGGFEIPAPGADGRSKSLVISSAALSPDKPLTVMLWWRLDRPVPEDGCYGLMRLFDSGVGGHISCFVRGRGEWCGLKAPTWVYQIHGFQGIENINDLEAGPAPTAEGVWRHTAVTISNSRQISWYQDGRPAREFITRGRCLRKGEIQCAELGGGGFAQPVTIDEFIVLDRALSPEEMMQYFRSAKAIRELENAP